MRRTAQLELRTWLQGNAAGLPLEFQQPSFLETRGPSEPFGQSGEDLLHAVRPAEGERLSGSRIHPELLELDPHSPIIHGLEGVREESGQLLLRGDRMVKHFYAL